MNYESTTAFPWHKLAFMHEVKIGSQNRILCVARNRPAQSPQLLLLHGVLRNWRTFYSILPDLNSHYSIAALDFRGHGGSAPCRECYRTVDYVEDAVALIDSLDEPVVVYGHSLGAMVALALAAERPQRIAAVIAEDPPFMTMGERLHGGLLQRYFLGIEQCLKGTEVSDSEALFEAISNIIVEEKPDGSIVRLSDQRDELSRRFLVEALVQIDPSVLAPITAGGWHDGYEMDQWLDRIECPVTILQADRQCGGMLTDEDVFKLKGQLGERCVVRVFPGVGHSIHWSRPREVVECIRETVLSVPGSQ